MNRREFVTLVSGTAVIRPLTARAQPAKLPTIAFVGDSASGWSPWTAAFERRLRENGWIDGQTVAVEYRWSEGRPDRVAGFAAEFVTRVLDPHFVSDADP
jgi:putative ABC transport system substrate-binding protein